MCVACEVITDQPVLIRSIEQGSGPGWSLYACADCAPTYLTTAEAFQLLMDHVGDCQICVETDHPTESCTTARTLIRVHRSCYRNDAQGPVSPKA
ncbi:hypothetical protein ACH4L7_30040 [Streptomyces anulatus]